MTELNDKSVFLTALEIADGGERAAYLNQACGGNSVFRKRIEALLVEHERSGQFLNVPVLDQLAAAQDSDESEVTITTQGSGNPPNPIDFSFLEPSNLPGSMGKLGHYEIREMIGRGGCGIVLKAFDTKLERTVAIKVMYPALAATSPARKRFLREARATAAIRHKNVVSIYAVEEQPLPFLVMELIDGPTLQQKINAIGPLDLLDVLEIGQQAAAGLAAAHAKGLIHRDIKPANILLEGNSNEVKLTDFGLARSADDASITQSGIISGTPLYMSPEQAQGLEMDERSDLFSLGSVLYVMTSGRPPFRAKATLAVLRRVVEDEPRPIQQIIPEVPDWMVTIVEILLAKEPDRRFTNAREVELLLQKCHDAVSHHQEVVLPAEVLRKASHKSQVTGDRKSGTKQTLAVAGVLLALIVIVILASFLSQGRTNSSTSLTNTLTRSQANLIDPDASKSAEKIESPKTETAVETENEQPNQQPAYTDRTAKRAGGGVWVNDGEEFVQSKPEAAAIYFGDPNWTDYDVSVEMKTLSTATGSQGGSLFLRAEDDRNRYSFTPGNYFAQGSDLAYRKNGVFHRDNTYKPSQYEHNRWYFVRAEVRGRSIRVWLDDQLMFQTDNKQFPKGCIGLATWNSVVRWRNLTVTDPNGKLLWKGFPEGDTTTINDLDMIATGTWRRLLRSQEEFDQVLAASPPIHQGEDAYAKYIDGVTELHAKNLFFTDIIAKDAIIRAKVQKIKGSWGGFNLRANQERIILYLVNNRKFDLYGSRGVRLAEVVVENEQTEFVDLALAAIGKSISVYINGKKVFEKEDDRATSLPGMPVLRASNNPPNATFQFKDVEIMVLDQPLSEPEQEKLAAMQWACQNGGEMNGYIKNELVTFDRSRLPIVVPPNGLFDFDMREMSKVSVETATRLNRLPNVHRVFNAPRGADDALLLQLLQTPGINFAPHFDIRDSQVTDNFLENLKDLPHLYGVCLNNTQISSKGLEHLLDLSNKGVMLENCPNIDDEACEVLASRSRWLWLTLAGTSITDKGLEKLSACSGLGSVDVRRCNVTEAAIQKLSNDLPTLEIIWDGGKVLPKKASAATYTNSRNMQFALVPHGKAWLGGENGEAGTTEVTFDEDFYLGTTEVTQEQWSSLMGYNPSYFQRSGLPGRRNSPGAEAVKDLTDAEIQKLPVELVSWKDIQQFLDRLNAENYEEGWTYRLPTEAEWEYACRNGPMTSQEESAFSYYFAEGSNQLDFNQANIGNRLARTNMVGSYAPNKLGLYDMHGNLYEWCQDSITTTSGELRHPVRGGGFFHGPAQNKVTKRNLDPPDFRNYLSGFRLARVRTHPP